MGEGRSNSLWHPGPLSEGIFLRRLNRFVAEVEMSGEPLLVHVPNTGRMGELLIPGVRVRMITSGGKYPFRIVFFYYKDRPVLIDSIAGNAIFTSLLENDRVPGMEGIRVLRREPAWGRHRFDFLFRDKNGREMMGELKSCTLAYDRVAAFPDAVSSRAADHVRALAETGEGKLIFFNLHEGVERFLPNYHTDFNFYETLKDCRDKIDIRSYSVAYDEDLGISRCRAMEVLIPEVEARGIYMLVLENDRDRNIETGSPGGSFFRKGCYVHVAHGRENLFREIEGLRRKKKGTRQIDFIAAEMKIMADMPIVSGEFTREDAAEFLRSTGGYPLSSSGGEGSADESFLFYFEENPLKKPSIWDFLLSSRYNHFN